MMDMRYADPSLCPDCRSDLPREVTACPTCGLLVRHPLAGELFATLQRADSLVQGLRRVSTVTAATATRAPAPSTHDLGSPFVPPVGAPAPPQRPPAAVPPPPPMPAGGVRPSSVPKILLGLGALFLLVAAVIFLAVSWSHLGVGGRTAVLVGLTVLSGGAALLLHRFELRIAAESLIVVALGMLGLDVVGAGSAGWLGGAADATTVAVAGLVLTVAGAAVGAVRLGARPRLVAPQVVSGLGLLIGYCGAVSGSDHDLLLSSAAVALGGGAVLLARSAGLPALAWSLLGAVALVWAAGALLALADALERPELATMWGVEGNGWALLFSAAALVAPGVVLRHRALLQWGGSCAALLVTAALAVPCVDTSAATVGLVALLVTLGWAIALAVLPPLLRPVAVAPAVIGGLLLAGLELVTAAVALARWVDAASGTGLRPSDRFSGPAPVTEPLLAVPSALLVVAIVALLAPLARDRSRPVGTGWAGWAGWAGWVTGVAATVTVASYDVPVAAALAVLLLTAAAAAAAALAMDGARHTGLVVAALAATTAGLLLALPWPALTVAGSAVALAVTAVLHLRARSDDLRALVGVGVAPALAVLVWSTAATADLDVAWRGVPLLVLLGVLAIARPRPVIEAPALVAGLVGAVAAVEAATDAGGSAALHLTVLGCLVSATALIHTARRPAAGVGGALLLLATWVRLGDLGVSEPEAYTLPLAAVLTGLGMVRLRRDPAASTAATLTPGLLLATVPSLVWVLLDDPTSLRAVLLGAGAVTLTIAGAALRWSAPLVIGATVGGTLVLRELGPYAGDAPVWVWIALGGALLVAVGITWERQLLEIKKAAGMLGRLR